MTTKQNWSEPWVNRNQFCRRQVRGPLWSRGPTVVWIEMLELPALLCPCIMVPSQCSLPVRCLFLLSVVPTSLWLTFTIQLTPSGSSELTTGCSFSKDRAEHSEVLGHILYQWPWLLFYIWYLWHYECLMYRIMLIISTFTEHLLYIRGILNIYMLSHLSSSP